MASPALTLAATHQLYLVSFLSWFIYYKNVLFLDEELPSIFTDVRNARILPWIKKHAKSATSCGKDQNDHDPQMEFRNFPDERQEEAGVDEKARLGQLVSIIYLTDLDLEDRGRTKAGFSSVFHFEKLYGGLLAPV